MNKSIKIEYDRFVIEKCKKKSVMYTITEKED